MGLFQEPSRFPTGHKAGLANSGGSREGNRGQLSLDGWKKTDRARVNLKRSYRQAQDEVQKVILYLRNLEMLWQLGISEPEPEEDQLEPPQPELPDEDQPELPQPKPEIRPRA